MFDGVKIQRRLLLSIEMDRRRKRIDMLEGGKEDEETGTGETRIRGHIYFNLVLGELD